VPPAQDNSNQDLIRGDLIPAPEGAAAPEEPRKDEPAGNEPPRSAIAEWTVTVLLLLFGTTTLAQAFVIPSGSMEDTLLIGDHLIVDKLAYAPAGAISRHLLPYEEPKHGDVIVFRYPGNIAETYVKRVIGVPGDHLKLVDRIVYRNGVRLNEPYVVHKFPYDPDRDNFPGPCCLPVQEALAQERQRDMLDHHVVNGEVVVPPGSFFAMGDNRDDSSDSRYWGFVPRGNIIGKPVLIYWSYRAPEATFTGDPLSEIVDLGEHFFTRTRWNRTFHTVHGFPDSAMPAHPLPLNPGLPNP
jgi:signal peptidase I